MKFIFYVIGLFYLWFYLGCSPSNLPLSPSLPPKSSDEEPAVVQPEPEPEPSFETPDEPEEEPNSPPQITLSDDELVKAKKQLREYQEIYKTKIKPEANNDYSGFNNRFAIFNGEDSLLTRLTYDELLFYADLADLIYVNKFKNIDDIEVGLLEKLHDEKYKKYAIIGTVKRYSSTELSAILLYSKEKNHFIVVFRGSVSLTDWAKNVNFVRFSGADPLGALNTLDGTKLNIHRGFAEIYLEGVGQDFDQQFKAAVSEHLDDMIGRSIPLRITTIGHSLGGALALLKANDFPRILLSTGLFTDDSMFSIETLSFGAPRVYDEDSSILAQESIGGVHDVVRFVHEADPVPNLPTSHLGGAKIGTPIYANALLGSGAIKNVVRHMMGSYLKWTPTTFKKIKGEILWAREVKNKIIELKKLLQDESKNDFDDTDARHKFTMLLARAKAKRTFVKKVLDMSISDREATQKRFDFLTKEIENLENQLRNLKSAPKNPGA